MIFYTVEVIDVLCVIFNGPECTVLRSQLRDFVNQYGVLGFKFKLLASILSGANYDLFRRLLLPLTGRTFAY
jgi:hypothetical protein